MAFLQHVEFEDDDAPRPQFCDAADIYLAARTGDLDRIRVLVEQDGVDINRRDFWDSVPLYYASLCGHLDVVRYFLEHGAICNENTFDGDRCLYGALTVEIRELLLKADIKKVPPLKPLAQALRKLCALCDDPEQPTAASRAFDPCCDLELLVGDVVYRLNRAVMAARLSRFDEILSSQPVFDGVERISFPNGHVSPKVAEALLVYVYSGRIDLEMREVDHLLKLAKHCGNPALVKMVEKELYSIKYYFKSIKKNSAPRRFVLYPCAFPDEASLEHDLGTLHDRSRDLDPWMRSSHIPWSELCVRTDYADAVLEVEEALFRVHLCVLCSRSEFFFQLAFCSSHGFEELPKIICPLFETPLAVLHVSETRSEPLRHVLAYLYRDNVASLDEWDLMDLRLVSELFELANRFLIFGMKRLVAERVMQLEASLPYICELIQLADFYEVAVLRDYGLERLAQRLDEILSADESSTQRVQFEAFVEEMAPENVSDAETLFDSSDTKGDFHGVITGTAATGVGSNTILEDLREKYLEIYGWEGEERDAHARDFDQRFLRLALNAVRGRRA